MSDNPETKPKDICDRCGATVEGVTTHTPFGFALQSVPKWCAACLPHECFRLGRLVGQPWKPPRWRPKKEPVWTPSSSPRT